MEIYVDDMIAKFRTEEDHLKDIQKIFEQLRKYGLMLNPNKCILGATFDKLLGFTVSQ